MTSAHLSSDLVRGARVGANSGRLTVDTPAPGVRVIHLSGVLDTRNGARLLRLIDSQLALVRSGHRRLHTVIVDAESLLALERGGPEALAHARYTCERMGVEVVLTGAAGGLAMAALPVRGRLSEFRMFPTVDAALDALASSSIDETAGPATLR